MVGHASKGQIPLDAPGVRREGIVIENHWFVVHGCEFTLSVYSSIFDEIDVPDDENVEYGL